MSNDIDQLRLDRRRVMQATAAAAAALLLPGTAFAEDTPRKGGTLRIAMPYNPGSVDPMTGRNLTDFNVLYGVFDALVDFEPLTLELKPGLAKSWKFEDLKTLVLELQEGVTFHDGSPFNADAVKFNLDRYKNDPRSNVKSDLGSVESVEVNAPNKVTIRLNKPNVGLPVILTNRVGLMVSPKSIQEKGPNVDRNPVGTGPFKFVSWQDNDSFVLTRNENYWKPGLPYLDGLNMRIISELNTVARTVTAGECDVALNLQPQQKVVADRASGVVTKVFPSLVPYLAFINYGRPPLDNLQVRQALNYAINRDEINKVAALASANRRARSCPRRTGPATRRRSTTTPTTRRRRRSSSPTRAIRTGLRSKPSVGPTRPPCSGKRLSSRSWPRSASASSSRRCRRSRRCRPS